MFQHFSKFSFSTVASVLVGCGFFSIPAAAQGCGVQEVHCDAQPTDAAWQRARASLRSHGLVLCPGAQGVADARLLVVDSLVASTVLRGPLADGEWVEPDKRQSGDEQAVAPDVQFNRRWLASVMAMNGVSGVRSALAGGLGAAQGDRRIALR